MDQDKIRELYEIFSLIEENYFKNENKWIAGENLTVADFAYASTVAGLIVSRFFRINSNFNCVVYPFSVSIGNWSIS